MRERVSHKCIRKRVGMVLLAAMLAFSLFACGNSTEADAAPSAVSGAAGAKNTSGSYKIPAFRGASFDASAAESSDSAAIDLSSCSEGYVAMRCDSGAKIKFQVIKDEVTYTYSVVTGKDQIFPLQMGDGHYTFKVMENITDNKYAELLKAEADVTIADPLDPFLRPNQYADYTEQSDCVRMARGFAESAAGMDDKELASSVKPGYLPEPDRTMKDKKGICFDYASLAASMLRSQGVPTKIIFGYVAPNDVYHAWNKFYTEKGGWTLVELKVTGKDWNRIDLTFSANGGDGRFIGDGSNYMEAFEY